MNRGEEMAHDDLVERAAGLVPRLRERAQETEKLRRLPDETFRELRASGLLDLFRPRRHGGLQARLRTAFDVATQLARGCGSTSWIVGQLNLAMWSVCALPEGAREEILGQPDSSIIFALLGRGSAKRVAGGYQINGVWPFCSGSRHVTWFGLGLPVEDGSGGAAPAYFIVPASAVEILDDWHVSGLCGTSSNSTAAHDLFVPDRRVAPVSTVFSGDMISPDLTGSPYRCPMVQGIVVLAASCALGMAQAALEVFKAQTEGRGISFTLYAKKAEAPVTHLLLAEAAMKVRAADLLFHAAVEELERGAQGAGAMDVELLIRIRTEAASAVHLCREAVDILFGASGGSSLALSNPIQRIARDARAICQHAAYCLPTNLEAYGRVMLGLPPNLPFV
ncbi:acyl-CoA dehydrogenase [Sorangium cellulosum]|uniref:Acyl-CoA dehydrogenase n=1 Tax=Sorangium cellulosum TaxID=56 RepID=A0A2L0FBI2_SORCE|nr:acyl-CoA dehydrogenase family protein [Sorangium cellulosum]AUX48832.1 acyl-CoA dehydrogenase [Sorangium cellulosum]